KKSIRYIFFGGCTTLVNLVSYGMLRYVLGVDMSTSNVISIFLAIIFAYIVNKKFVFQSQTSTWKETIEECLQFIGMRLTTMIIEIYGMVLMSSVWGMNDMLAKFVIQFVILVLNYLISQFLVFHDKSDLPLDTFAAKKLKTSRRWCFLLSFSIPVLVITIGFICNGVYPFGDHAVLIIDSAHQYLPFFTELLRKLKAGESLLYTFRGGMGINFWGLTAYYLASPLNFLILLFNENHVMEGMALIILLKIGLSGGLFSYYLNFRSKKSNLTVVTFSIMFALSNFMIGYYFNIMWLDSIMLLPMVMMGIEKIAKGKSGRFYGVFLALTLFSNYYIGFMVCLFSCIYFLIQLIIGKRQSISNIFKRCISFGGYSLLAGGLSAIMLVPAYKALAVSQSITDNSGFPKTVEFYTDFLSMITQHFAFVEPINISSERGDLNVYCGIIVFIVILLYLLDHKINKRERVSKILFCILLFVSFNTNILNYVWHGFHQQNGLPNRFAFLYIALLVTMGFDVIQDLKSMSIKRVAIACVVPIVLMAAALVFRVGDHKLYTYGISLVFINIYAWLMILYKIKEFKKFYFQLALCMIVVVELTANGIFGVINNGTIGRSAYLKDKNNFQALMEDTKDDSFYRSEMDNTLIRNEIMYQGGNGIVIFSSTVPSDMINFVRKLGMEGRMNKSGYPGATRLVNDMLGIRYIASKTKTEQLFGFPKIDEKDNLALYENETALSLGFMVDDNVKEWSIEEKAHTQVQDDFIALALGESPLYQQLETYSIKETKSMVFHLEPGQQVYLDLEREVEEVKIIAPDYTRTYDKYTDHLYDLGCYDDGADVTVEFTVKEDNTRDIGITTYGYQEEDYHRIIQAMSKNQMEITEQESDHVYGTIDVQEPGTLLLTVPYEEGWKITVDGKEVEKYAVGNSIIGIDLEGGEHVIKMNFVPEGLWMGSGISVISIAVFFLFQVFERKFIISKSTKKTQESIKTTL
ncbi:MAG TPA: YfhO family protein, partial [Candidatus Merdenecus merdavium]|nr:YfhO family protein [Candidatus Merdenecus merdavium]